MTRNDEQRKWYDVMRRLSEPVVSQAIDSDMKATEGNLDEEDVTGMGVGLGGSYYLSK